MYSYFVYPSFPLIGVVGTVSLVITFPGASGSKAQMVAPCGGAGATKPVTLDVTCHSWRLLQSWRSFTPAPMEVTGLGLFCRGRWLRPGAMVVVGLDLLSWMSLA